jgi:hypothetical protein
MAVEQSFPPEKRLVSDDVAYRFLPLAGKAMVTLTRFPPARALRVGVADWPDGKQLAYYN